MTLIAGFFYQKMHLNFLNFFLLFLTFHFTVGQDEERPVFIDHYYRVDSDADADFYESQLFPELQEQGDKVMVAAYPYRGMVINEIEGSGGTLNCTAKGNNCYIGLLHVSF